MTPPEARRLGTGTTGHGVPAPAGCGGRTIAGRRAGCDRIDVAASAGERRGRRDECRTEDKVFNLRRPDRAGADAASCGPTSPASWRCRASPRPVSRKRRGRLCTEAYELVVGCSATRAWKRSARSSCRTRRRSSPARSRRRPARRRSCSTRTTTSCPVGDESKWESPPFEATERDGAIYGRGAADSKSNILMHVGALRAWDGKPPVGIKIVIEGQEEIGSAFSTYPPTQPELFAADAMVIGDMGSVRPGVPTLTVALRGMASVIVEVRTLAGPKHSGQFGGAAPDALLTLLHALATLHDEQRRRRRGRAAARGVDGRVVQRRGVPRPRRDRCRACRSSAPAASARASGRARRSRSPASTCRRSTTRSTRSCRTRAPSSACASIPSRTRSRRRRRSSSTSRRCGRSGSRSRSPRPRPARASPRRPTGPAYEAARAALATAWGSDPRSIATGGSIPLVSALSAGGARRRDPALRHDRRLREHPRAERARAASTSSRRRWSPRPSSSAASPSVRAGGAA